MFRNRVCTDSTPSRGTIPQGKGREGKRKGTERNATAILLVVKSCKSAIKFNSATREGVELDGSH